MAKITLGYWDLRGVAEPIRYLLHYKKVKFEDKRYQFGSDAWQKDKYSLDLDFPNLPYYLEGNIKLSQSTTILRYLASKYGLDGKTEDQKLRASLVEQQIFDMRLYMITVCLGDNFEKKKAEFVQKAPEFLMLFSNFLEDKEFLVGDSVTYVDFMAYDILDFYRLFIPGVLNDFPTLKEYRERIINLPELQEYVHSSTYKRWPISGPTAKFGHHGEEPKVD